MTEGYCLYHRKYLRTSEVKWKSCRCKPNTKKRCRHYIEVNRRKKKLITIPEE